jgi:hypothetical protein
MRGGLGRWWGLVCVSLSLVGFKVGRRWWGPGPEAQYNLGELEVAGGEARGRGRSLVGKQEVGAGRWWGVGRRRQAGAAAVPVLRPRPSRLRIGLCLRSLVGKQEVGAGRWWGVSLKSRAAGGVQGWASLVGFKEVSFIQGWASLVV